MNPIPLAAPDGQIYAYACGECHHVSASASMLIPSPHNGPFPQLVRGSLDDATRCCTCHDCRAPLVRSFGSISCDTCRAWNYFISGWCFLRVGYVPAEPGSTAAKACAICGNPESNYCRSTPKCVDCSDGHGGNQGRCRDCALDYYHREDP